LVRARRKSRRKEIAPEAIRGDSIAGDTRPLGRCAPLNPGRCPRRV